MEITLCVCEETPKVAVVETYEFLIGRGHDCDLQLASPLVSRQHCALTVQDNVVCVRDLHSLNGTALNNGVLIGNQTLHDGDMLWLAGTAIEVHIRQRDAVPVNVAKCLPDMGPTNSITSGAQSYGSSNVH
jgi:pSer/pThr/pTyr-binding forkhead associated (FHA) protein